VASKIISNEDDHINKEKTPERKGSSRQKYLLGNE